MRIVDNPETRKIMTKFRLNLLGSKNLYNMDNIQNTCSLCCNSVETMSEHLLMKCKNTMKERNEVFRKLSHCDYFLDMN